MKLSGEKLKALLQCIKPDERVVVPPLIGYDAGVHRIGDQYLVVAADPCTGVPEEWFGWLLINYAASDVALSGAKPEFCTVTLLGPRPTDPVRFQRAMQQTCQAADELDIAIVRGHTGMYDSLNDLVGVCTVYGTVKPARLITSGDAKAGDLILCTKPLGLETVTNFALAHKEAAQNLFSSKNPAEYSELVSMQSCVKEALSLAEVEGVHAMHDATEGGFVAALNELAGASKLGFEVDWNKIAIQPEALVLQRHFDLSDAQLLAMSSTGTILAAVEPKAKRAALQTLEGLGLRGYFIGQFTEYKDRIIAKGQSEAAFPEHADDPYTAMMATTF
ncbi:MAG: AIR synthase-related protein [Candidatus Bathyarchaeota archaeon]|nr:AIR synthase-related protein [Candidatus Bathyarchaeota archaeon]